MSNVTITTTDGHTVTMTGVPQNPETLASNIEAVLAGANGGNIRLDKHDDIVIVPARVVSSVRLKETR